MSIQNTLRTGLVAGSILTHLAATAPAHAGSNFALPANQITGCPWDNDPENAGSAAVDGSRVKIGKEWYDVSGGINTKAMADRLTSCGVGTPTYSTNRYRQRRITGSTAATNFKKWRSAKSQQVWGIGLGLAGLATYGGVCGFVAPGTAFGEDGLCWLVLGVYPVGIGLLSAVGLGAGLVAKPGQYERRFVDEVDGHFVRIFEKSEEMTAQLNDLRPKCIDAKPRSTEAAVEATASCKALVDMLKSQGAAGILKNHNPPSIKEVEAAMVSQSALALSGLCKDYNTKTTSQDLKAAADSCKALQQVWRKNATVLGKIDVISTAEASATYQRAYKRQQEAYKEENSPERRAARKKATSDCQDVYTTFATSTAKTKDGWMACCTASVLKRGSMSSPNKIIRECKGK